MGYNPKAAQYFAQEYYGSHYTPPENSMKMHITLNESEVKIALYKYLREKFDQVATSTAKSEDIKISKIKNSGVQADLYIDNENKK